VHRKDSSGNIVSFEDQDALSDYNIVPAAGNAALRIGTRDLHSWFPGAIGKIAVYNYEPDATKVLAHAKSMFGYDHDILSDHPLAFWNTASGIDVTGNGHSGTGFNSPGSTLLPDGGTASVFNGINQYFEVSSAPDLSVPATGILTLEAWMRPDTLDFAAIEGSGYVHWMGKGETSSHEYAARMYGQHPTGTDSPRINRISGYVFNPAGGLGAGSYYQPNASRPLKAGEWIHYTLVINTVATSAQYPTGYTKLYVHRKNSDGTIATFTDQDALIDYNIVPRAGNAPLRIGTKNFSSWFRGAIGKAAVYNYELSAASAAEHTAKMFGGG